MNCANVIDNILSYSPFSSSVTVENYSMAMVIDIGDIVLLWLCANFIPVKYQIYAFCLLCTFVALKVIRNYVL